MWQGVTQGERLWFVKLWLYHIRICRMLGQFVGISAQFYSHQLSVEEHVSPE